MWFTCPMCSVSQPGMCDEEMELTEDVIINVLISRLHIYCVIQNQSFTPMPCAFFVPLLPSKTLPCRIQTAMKKTCLCWMFISEVYFKDYIIGTSVSMGSVTLLSSPWMHVSVLVEWIYSRRQLWYCSALFHQSLVYRGLRQEWQW